MTASRATVGAFVMGAVLVALLVAVLALREFAGAAVAGLAVGAGVGGLNLVVGSWLLSWALKNRPKAALKVSLGGFFVRLALLLVLTWVFWTVPGVDAVTFAISFVIFFFLFLVVEIVIIGRASRRTAEAGASE